MAKKKKSKLSNEESTREALTHAVERGIFKSWGWCWKKFLRIPAHVAWWERHSSLKRAVYLIDPDIVKKLAAPIGKKLLMSSADSSIELAFAHCCLDYSSDTCGVWQNRPIKYGLIGQPNPMLRFPDDFLQTFRWNKTLEEKKLLLQMIGADEEIVNRNRRRWAGELVCNEEFLKKCQELQQRWLRLKCHVEFPFRRHGIGIGSPNSKESASATRTAHTFIADAIALLDRFELSELTTFDLPLPFGPLNNLPASTLGSLIGDTVISHAYPHNFSVSHKELLGAVCRLVMRGAKSHAEKTRPALRPQDISIFERAFDMRFIEIAYRSRYGAPRGYAACLEVALANKFGIDENRVHQVRREYARLLP